MRDTPAGRILPGVMAEAAVNPEMREVLDRLHPGPTRAGRARSCAAGVERGELPPDTDVELMLDLLGGTVIFRELLAGAPGRRRRDRAHGRPRPRRASARPRAVRLRADRRASLARQPAAAGLGEHPARAGLGVTSTAVDRRPARRTPRRPATGSSVDRVA